MPIAANKSSLIGEGAGSVVFGTLGKFSAGLTIVSVAGVKGISVMSPSPSSFEFSTTSNGNGSGAKPMDSEFFTESATTACAPKESSTALGSDKFVEFGAVVFAPNRSSAVLHSDNSGVVAEAETATFAPNKSSAVLGSIRAASDAAVFAPNKSSAVMDSGGLPGIASVELLPNKSSAVVATLPGVLTPVVDTVDLCIAATGGTKSGLSTSNDPGTLLLLPTSGGLENISSAFCTRS
mmetsp:Transcript_26331/g.61863  ORF Transcript_26331/g.61863 Transcript_26331/m.61863 type:complete len:237 (+) Transcript_26331:616-1326(+)